MQRAVAVFTATRADYGLQYPVLLALARHPKLRPVLIASSAHLDHEFGHTVDEIERDGFRVDARVPLPQGDDTLVSTVQAIGAGVQGIGRALADLAPDMLLVHGDRYEALAAAVAGTQMRIPTAQIEAGDLTDGGALDDSVRHAITKLAHLHFTSNDDASARVCRLGEEPWRIHTVGLPSLDLIRQQRYATPGEIASSLAIDVERPIVLFTQHSVTTEFEQAIDQVQPALSALETIAGEGAQVVITYPNNDAGGRRIGGELARFGDRRIPGVQIRHSLGRHLYHGLLAVCGRGRGVCAGNSSSGIKETPAFGCPAVNIGSRQQGRLRGANVIDVDYDRDAILAALRRSLCDDDFRRACADASNPYGEGHAGDGIAEVLASVEMGPKLLQKRMTY